MGLQEMVCAVSFKGPVLHPHVEPVCRRTRLSEGTPTDLFTEEKCLFVFIGEGEVGKIEALERPF